MDTQAVAGDLPAKLAGPLRDVCVAVLDGPVDLDHPCFAGADLTVVDTLVRDPAGDGAMSTHGTHVASLLFGQPGSPVAGLVPSARGLILPVFQDNGLRLSQLDLARAIEAAVEAGADIISISGGELTPTGTPDSLLDNALRLCAANDVLVVAAVGNDGEPSVHVPAADPSVLAVGACTDDGVPLPTNNWGAPYRTNAVLAPGYDVEGARPGGDLVRLSGSSFATPLVSGVAALLLATARQAGNALEPSAIRDLILAAATQPPDADDAVRDRYLAGVLDVPAAFHHLNESEMTMDEVETTTQPPTEATAPPPTEPPPPDPVAPAGVTAACADQTPAAGGSCGGQASVRDKYIYAIGTIGWDFGTEARRDGFIQQMDVQPVGGHLVPANPYDPHQLATYLADNPWASDKLIWTCNLDGRTAIYALEAETPFGMAWGGPRPYPDGGTPDPLGYPPVSVVHKTFRDAIVGQALAPENRNYVSRVSVPGTLTNRTVRLYSGHQVPVVKVHAQGLYTWNEAVLLDNLIEAINEDFGERQAEPPPEETVRLLVRAFLDKVYYQFRNLGQSAPDRALNYAATNAFELTRAIAKGFLSGKVLPRRADEELVLYALDDITVTPSRYARPDAQAYDVTITYYDTVNDRKPLVAYLETLDVNDIEPVILADPRQFLIRA